jgi:hypothetical protein
MDWEKQSVITVAVQYYTELVAVKGTAPYVFTAKCHSHKFGVTDDINSDIVVIQACHFSPLMVMSVCQVLWHCV